MLTAHMNLHSQFVWERFATAIKIDSIPFLGGFALFKVSFSINLDARGQRPRSCETS